MRTLYEPASRAVDLSSLVSVLEYTNHDSRSLMVAAMIHFTGLSGVGGNYAAQLFVNDAIFIPDRQITFPAGRTAALMQSRTVMMRPADVLQLKMLGAAGDTAVQVDVHVVDMSPTAPEEVISLISPDLVEALNRAAKTLKISVRPERVILAPG
jgi:hypothetical protein